MQKELLIIFHVHIWCLWNFNFVFFIFYLLFQYYYLFDKAFFFYFTLLMFCINWFLAFIIGSVTWLPWDWDRFPVALECPLRTKSCWPNWTRSLFLAKECHRSLVPMRWHDCPDWSVTPARWCEIDKHNNYFCLRLNYFYFTHQTKIQIYIDEHFFLFFSFCIYDYVNKFVLFYICLYLLLLFIYFVLWDWMRWGKWTFTRENQIFLWRDHLMQCCYSKCTLCHATWLYTPFIILLWKFMEMKRVAVEGFSIETRTRKIVYCACRLLARENKKSTKKKISNKIPEGMK